MADEFDDAIEIGRNNAVLIELSRRHCQLMEFVADMGHGLLEEATGLPINSRRIRCPRANGTTSGMQLRYIVGEFFETNCVGCEIRRPTGELPNLETLMTEQSAEAAEAERQAQARLEFAREQWQCRRDVRQALAVETDIAGSNILADLDVLDRDPAADRDRPAEQAARARVIALAERAPSLFSPALIEVLIGLHEQELVGGLLEPLRLLARADPALGSRFSQIALSQLETSADAEAARLLLQEATHVVLPVSATVVGSLLKVACSPRYGTVGHLEPGTLDPAILTFVDEIAREQMVEVLTAMLPRPRSTTPLELPAGAAGVRPDPRRAEMDRATAAEAVSWLVRERPSVAHLLVDPLIGNLAVGGDNYERIPSASSC